MWRTTAVNSPHHALRTQIGDFLYLTTWVQQTDCSFPSSIQSTKWEDMTEKRTPTPPPPLEPTVEGWWEEEWRTLTCQQYKRGERALPFPHSAVWAERDCMSIIKYSLHYTSLQPWFIEKQLKLCSIHGRKPLWPSCGTLLVWVKAVKDTRGEKKERKM